MGILTRILKSGRSKSEGDDTQSAWNKTTEMDYNNSLQNWALPDLMLTALTGIIMMALLVKYIKILHDYEYSREYVAINKCEGFRFVTVAASMNAKLFMVRAGDAGSDIALLAGNDIWQPIIYAITLISKILSNKKREISKSVRLQK